MITTTLKDLRAAGACIDGYNKLVRSLQGKEFIGADSERETYIRFAHNDAIPLLLILESNGIDDALWALRACEQTTEMVRAERLYGVWCARRVQHLMGDPRSIAALDVAERHANGDATGDDLAAVWAAAWDAAWAAARDAARGAARAAALAAARAAARGAARGAVWADARAAQTQMFIAVFCSDGAPNIMDDAQKLQWAMRNGLDGCDGDGEGVTRANEREVVIKRAECRQ